MPVVSLYHLTACGSFLCILINDISRLSLFGCTVDVWFGLLMAFLLAGELADQHCASAASCLDCDHVNSSDMA